MGLFDFVRNQLIDVIEWTDSSTKTMVSKYNMNNKEIMMGAQLTVRESQVAVFVNEGQIADVFQPGRYELSTSNMPVLTKLKAWKFGFNSPFKADVYFINTKQFLDYKWGTANPVMMRDTEFGMIRLRAFGIYSFRVVDPVKFLREVFGTSALFTTEGVEGQLKRTIVSSLSDVLAESKIPALDLAANYDELSTFALRSLNAKASALGLEIVSFVIENISLPEEVEKVMDRRTSMGVAGDLNRYTQYQAAEAMREAANAPGGNMAGMGVAMGAAAAMGQRFVSSMNAPDSPAKPAAPASQPLGSFCHECGTQMAPDAKFCPNCGKKVTPPAGVCPSCGATVGAGAKFCGECGHKL